MSLTSRLREAIFGAPPPKEINKGAAIFSSMSQAVGVTPSTSFANQITVYLEDPVVKESILQMAQEIISTGYFTTANEAYGATMPTGPGGKSWTAKEAIDYWSKVNNLDEKLLQIAIELVAFGNSFWNITNSGFVNIPLEAVSSAIAADPTTPLREKYNLRLTGAYGSKMVKYEEFSHFHTEPIGCGPMGSGIILGLISTPASYVTAEGETVAVPSLYDIRKAVRASMKEGFTKFSFGNELWIFEGMSDAGINEMGPKLESMPSTGQRIVSNMPGDIKLALPQRTQSYDKWIEQIDNEFLMSLGNPSLKLGLEQGFTKATAEAARELYEMKIAALRRIMKRHIEAIWVTVLNRLGFDGQAAEVRLNFGSPEIEYKTQDVFSAVDKGVISTQEARNILTKNMKWELDKT